MPVISILCFYGLSFWCLYWTNFGCIFSSLHLTSIDRFHSYFFGFINSLSTLNKNLRKRTLKKLIKESCSNTVFTANKKLYQQIDGVSMGSSLKLLLVNVVMTQLKGKVIKQFNNDKLLRFMAALLMTL